MRVLEKTYKANNLPPKNIRGIYCITNSVNNKKYIGQCGSAIGIRQRFNQHISNLRTNKHPSTYLQNSWNKYGEEAFRFEILLHTEVLKALTPLEQTYFNLYRPEYNSAPAAGSTLGFKQSEETIQKLSKSFHLYNPKGEVVEGVNLKNTVGKII